MNIYRVPILILAFSLIFSLKTLEAEIKKNHLIVGTIAELLSNAKFFELDQQKTWQQLTAETPIKLDDFLLDVFLSPNEINPYLHQIHPICQYPALFLWLKSKLPYDFQKLELPYCEDLDRFYTEISANGISVLLVRRSIQEELFLKIKGKEIDHIIDFQPIPQAIFPSIWQGIIADLPHQYIWMKADDFYQKIAEEGVKQEEIYEANLLVPNAHKIIMMYIWQAKDQKFHRSFWHDQKHIALLKLIDLALPQSQVQLSQSLLWPYRALDTLKRLDRNQMIGKIFPSVQWNRGHFGHTARAGLGLQHSGLNQSASIYQSLSLALFSHAWSDYQLGFPIDYVQQWLKIDLRYQSDLNEKQQINKHLMIQDLVFVDWFKLRPLEEQALSWRLKSALWGERYGYIQGTVGVFASLLKDKVQMVLGPEFRIQRDFQKDRQMFQVNGSLMIRWVPSDKWLMSLQGGYRLGAFGDQSQRFGMYEILSENQYHIRSWLNVYYRVGWQSALLGVNHMMGVGVYF